MALNEHPIGRFFQRAKAQREINKSRKTQAEGSATHWKKLLFSFERPEDRGSIFVVRGSNGNSLREWRIKKFGKMETHSDGIE